MAAAALSGTAVRQGGVVVVEASVGGSLVQFANCRPEAKPRRAVRSTSSLAGRASFGPSSVVQVRSAMAVWIPTHRERADQIVIGETGDGHLGRRDGFVDGLRLGRATGVRVALRVSVDRS